MPDQHIDQQEGAVTTISNNKSRELSRPLPEGVTSPDVPLEKETAIELLFIPLYTSEVNLIERKELRARGLHNEVLLSLKKVVDGLCDTI